MTKLQEIGLKAIFDSQDFQKGLTSYLEGLIEASRATEAASASASGAGAILSGSLLGGATAATLGLGALAVVAGTTLKIGLETLKGAAELVVEVLNRIKDTAQTVLKQFMDLGSGALQTASRFQQLQLVGTYMGMKVGMAADEVDDMVKKMKEMGIQTDEAYSAVSQFARSGLDLTLLPELANAARNLAIMGKEGQNTSSTLNGLTYGIMRGSGVVLKHAGAQVDLNKAYEDFAQELGKSGGALTTQEKQQAALIAVINEGRKANGMYELSMKTAAKQMGSWTRIANEFKAALGAPFQNMFYNLIKAKNDLVSAMTAAIQKGGSLYGVIGRLGAVASAVGDQIGKIAKKISEWLGKSGEDWGKQLEAPILQMVSYGAKMMANLAKGIIRGAVFVVNAIKWIGQIIRAWFKPRSPPLVAPEIDAWGAQTIAVWLKGFQQADFSVLGTLQNNLRSVFDVMGRLGKISQLSGLKQLAGFSVEIMRTLGGGGKLDSNFYARLAQAAGDYGDELALTLQKQVELLDATKELKETEQALEDARRRRERYTKRTNRLIEEYNRLIRQGASAEQLAAKMAEIRGSEKERDLAILQVEENQEKAEIQRDYVGALQEQYSLQEQILNQMLEMGRLQAEMMEAQAGGGGGGGGAGDDMGGGPVFEDIDFPNIEEDFKEFKDEITRILEETWAEIELEWQNSNITNLWDETLKIWKLNIEETFPGVSAQIGIHLGNLKTIFGTFKEQIKADLDEVGLSFGGLGLEINIGSMLMAAGFAIMATMMTMVMAPLAGMSRALSEVARHLRFMKQKWDQFYGWFKEKWDEISAKPLTLERILGQVVGIVILMVGAIGFIIVTTFGSIISFIQGWIQGIVDFFQQLYNDLVGNSIVPDMMEEIYNSITGWLQSVLDSIPEFVKGMVQAGTDLLQGLWDGLTSKWLEVARWLSEKFAWVSEKWAAITKTDSPSKVFREHGRNLFKGLQLGMEDEVNKVAETMRNAQNKMLSVQPIGNTAFSPQYASPINLNINIQADVASDIDLNTLAYKTARIINREINR
jgi:signal transduction histidine kinase